PPISTLFPYTTLFRSHIEAVGVARAVMTGKALDAHAQEHAPDLGRHPVNPVQTVQTPVIVAIGKRPIAGRSLPDWIINGHGCRQDRKSTRLNSSHVSI